MKKENIIETISEIVLSNAFGGSYDIGKGLQADEVSVNDVAIDVAEFIYETLLYNKTIYKALESYIVTLTETTKSHPKTSYYICEYGGIINETPDINKATKFEHKEFAISLSKFINENYDFKAKVLINK